MNCLRLLPLLWLWPLVSASPGAVFTLDSAVAHALAGNPDLAAARLSVNEAEARWFQSGRLANPELEAGASPNIRGREFTISLGFVQRFPLTHRLRLERSVSQAELEAAIAEVRAAEWRLEAEVRAAGVKYLIVRENRLLKEKLIANSREAAKSAATMEQRGEGSEVDAVQLDLEAQQLELEVLQLDSKAVSLAGELSRLLGRRAGEPVEINGRLPAISLPGSSLVFPTGRADYQAARARAQAAREAVNLTRASRWEDAGIGLAAEVERSEDAPEGLETDGFIGLRFSLPLPLWKNQEARIREAEAAAARRDKELDALVHQLNAEAASSLSEMRSAAHMVSRITGTLLPQAQAIEEKLGALHQQGQPGTQFADVLRAREKRLAVEQAKLDALEAYHLARIRFQTATRP